MRVKWTKKWKSRCDEQRKRLCRYRRYLGSWKCSETCSIHSFIQKRTPCDAIWRLRQKKKRKNSEKIPKKLALIGSFENWPKFAYRTEMMVVNGENGQSVPSGGLTFTAAAVKWRSGSREEWPMSGSLSVQFHVQVHRCVALMVICRSSIGCHPIRSRDGMQISRKGQPTKHTTKDIGRLLSLSRLFLVKFYVFTHCSIADLILY